MQRIYCSFHHEYEITAGTGHLAASIFLGVHRRLTVVFLPGLLGCHS